jgi:hypothetical protein
VIVLVKIAAICSMTGTVLAAAFGAPAWSLIGVALAFASTFYFDPSWTSVTLGGQTVPPNGHMRSVVVSVLIYFCLAYGSWLCLSAAFWPMRFAMQLLVRYSASST